MARSVTSLLGRETDTDPTPECDSFTAFAEVSPMTDATLHSDPPRFSMPRIAAVLLVALSCIASYLALSQGLPGDFLLDDQTRVENIDVTTLAPQELLSAVQATDSGVLGRAIPLLTLYASKVVYGQDAGIYRLHNIFLHLITGLVMFWFSGRLLNSGQFRAHIAPHDPWLIAAGAASLWMLHPLQVSTALYIVQRMTQLSVLFTMLALLSYLALRANLDKRLRTLLLPGFALAVFTVAGLLSKESAALIPVFIILLEYFTFRFQTNQTQARIRLLVLLAAVAILPIMAGLGYFFTHTDTLLHNYVMRPFDLYERIATQCVVVWQYVGLILLPQLSSMTLYHDGGPIHDFGSPWFLGALTAWLAVVIVIWSLRRRQPVIAFGLAFFLASHLLESSILPLELMFEHRNYIGIIGLMLAFLAALISLGNHLVRLRPVLAGVVILVLAGWGGLQAARAANWDDPYQFALISAQHNPESGRAVSTLANKQAQRGYLEEAKGLLRMVIDNGRNRNGLPGLHLNLMTFHCGNERMPSDLVADTHAALVNETVGPYALTTLRGLKSRTLDGDCPALDRRTLLDLESAAASNPKTRRSYRFFFHSMAGVTHATLGDLEQSRTYLRRANEFADSVPRATRRDQLVSLAEVCIALRDRRCTRMALRDARSLDDRVKALTGAHKRLDAVEARSYDVFGEPSPENQEP